MKSNNENIQAELAELGIKLEHKPSMPLRVPDGYFESSKQEMLDTILALDFVENLPKSMPQEVPVGYFEQSKIEILAKITSTEQNPLTGHRTSSKKSWALAATMALLLSLGLFFINTDTGSNSSSLENQISSLSTEEVNGYIESYDYNFEAQDILENPMASSKRMKALEDEILNATKMMSDEELFEHVL